MSVRSIRLKLCFHRRDLEEKAYARDMRRALWSTHDFCHRCTSAYIHLLLEMRQKGLYIREGGDDEVYVSGEEWAERLEKRLRGRGVADDVVQEALPRLQALYGSIVKSSVEKATGKGTDSRAIHSVLVNAKSEGGAKASAKRRLFKPLWQRDAKGKAVYDGKPKVWASQAVGILEDESTQEVLGSSKKQDTWQKVYAKDPDNIEAWGDLLKKKLKEWEKAEAAYNVQGWLSANGVLPIMDSMSSAEIADTPEGLLSKYERSAFKDAVSILNAWESGNTNTYNEHQKRREAVEQWHEQHAKSHQTVIGMFRQMESLMTATSRRVGFGNASTTVRIGPRAVRGWSDYIAPWLREHPDATDEEVDQFVADRLLRLPRKRRGRLDVLMEFAQNRHFLLAHPCGDRAPERVAMFNDLLNKYERAKDNAILTIPDSVLHPRAVWFDPPTVHNDPPFDVKSATRKGPEREDGVGNSLYLTLELLFRPDDHEQFLKRKFTTELASSKQVQNPVVHHDRDGVLCVEYGDGKKRKQSALGGSTIQLRPGNQDLGDVADGHPSVWSRVAAYFQASVNVSSEVPDEVFKERLANRAWLGMAAGNRTGKKGREKAPTKEFRIMSVDLGLRTTAAVSFYDVKGVDGADVQWEHSGSRLLLLPGDQPTRPEQQRRNELREDLHGLMRDVGILQDLSALYRQANPDHRVKLANKIKNAGYFSDEESEELIDLVETADAAVWKPVVVEMWEVLERVLKIDVTEWRIVTRDKRRGRRMGSARPAQSRHADWKLGGVSAWKVSYLLDCYRLLLRWSLRHAPGRSKVRRANNDRSGQIGRTLREHINNMKDYRAKVTADMIVETAKAAGVTIIVMEDMARFKPSSGRSVRENKVLTRWAHQEVLKHVGLQAEEEGILVHAGYAAFTSRFDCISKAPGIRCHPVSADDMAAMQEDDRYWLKGALNALVRQGVLEKSDIEALRPGDLVPSDSGSLFVSSRPNRKGTLAFRDADINAASNIGRWYLDAYCRPFQVTARRVEDSENLAVVELGVRAAGAFGTKWIAFSRTSPEGEEPRYKLEKFSTVGKLSKWLGVPSDLLKRTKGDEDSEGELAEMAEDGIEDDDSYSGVLRGHVPLYTDPTDPESGFVHRNVFWEEVQKRTVRLLRGNNVLPNPNRKVSTS